MAKTFKKHDIGTSLNLSNFSFTLKQISCEFYFFLFFWPPPGIWNSQARDKIPATPMTYTAAVATLGPLTQCAGLGTEPVSWHCKDAADPGAPQQNS